MHAHAHTGAAAPITQALLNAYISQPRVPTSMPLHAAGASGSEVSSSLVGSFTRAASDLVTLPLRMTQLMWAPSSGVPGSPLADSALHLLLLLLHHTPPGQGGAPAHTFRSALQVRPLILTSPVMR